MSVESPDVPWAKNHDEHGMPPEFDKKPAKSARSFHSFLKSRKLTSGALADLGCGTGRNAVFFAKKGFEVHAIDRSETAIAGLGRHGIATYNQDLAECWLFNDCYFDFAMDVFCYSQESDESRKAAYRGELARSLRAGGYFLLTVPSRIFQKSGIEKEFPGFSIIASEESAEEMAGGKVRALSLIMKKR